MPAKINLLNQKFGKILVIEQTKQRKNKSIVWKCQCDCGNIEYFSTKELRNDGIIQCHKCGNKRQPKKIEKESIIGKRFTKLVVIEPTNQRKRGNIVYKCQCDCGKEIYAIKPDLDRGDIKSCGCIKRKYQIGDIINNRQILSFQTEKNKKKKAYYKCKCLLCGNIYEVETSVLDRTISCGCIKSIGERNIQQILINNHIPFIKEFSFQGSKYRYDFAILNKNKEIIRLIQFDGQQHYKENIKNSGWNNLQHYLTLKQHDKEKNKLTKKHQIPLIRIPYWERDTLTLEKIMGSQFLETL